MNVETVAEIRRGGIDVAIVGSKCIAKMRGGTFQGGVWACCFDGNFGLLGVRVALPVR